MYGLDVEGGRALIALNSQEDDRYTPNTWGAPALISARMLPWLRALLNEVGSTRAAYDETALDFSWEDGAARMSYCAWRVLTRSCTIAWRLAKRGLPMTSDDEVGAGTGGGDAACWEKGAFMRHVDTEAMKNGCGASCFIRMRDSAW